MIGAGGKDKQGKPQILIVLEPGNIARMQAGLPVTKNLSEFCSDLEGSITIAFSPDVVWVQEQVRAGKPLLQALEESLTRTEVFSRPYRDPERMKDVPA